MSLAFVFRSSLLFVPKLSRCFSGISLNSFHSIACNTAETSCPRSQPQRSQIRDCPLLEYQVARAFPRSTGLVFRVPVILNTLFAPALAPASRLASLFLNLKLLLLGHGGFNRGDKMSNLTAYELH